MAENSLFAVLLRSPWWVSVAAAAAIVAVARAALPEAYVPYGAMGALPLVVIGAVSALRQWRAPNPAQVEQALQALGGLGWRELAAGVEAGLRRDGYTVRSLRAGSADFEAVKAGRTVLVSARRWKAASVGVEPLRSLHAAMLEADAGEGWYLGLGVPTKAALRFARENRLRLVQGAELARLAGRG